MERDGGTFTKGGELFEQQLRGPLFASRQVGGGHGAGEASVPNGIGGEHHKVIAFRIGNALTCYRSRRCMQRDFRSKNGGEPMRAGSFSKADDTIKPIMISDCKTGEPKANGFLH